MKMAKLTVKMKRSLKKVKVACWLDQKWIPKLTVAIKKKTTKEKKDRKDKTQKSQRKKKEERNASYQMKKSFRFLKIPIMNLTSPEMRTVTTVKMKEIESDPSLF